MMKSFFLPLLLLVLWLTGCTALPWQRATPTPASADSALQRFLTRAPAPLRLTATPLPVADSGYLPPSGLPLPLVDPLTVAGNLTISGSPALAPLTRLLYAGFVSTGYRNTMRIEEVSADSVFVRYCSQVSADQPAVDIVMTDRPIKQSELELCLQQQRRPVALRVALHAVVVVVRADADFVTEVSKAELVKLFTASKWSAVRYGWPDTEIARLVPPVASISFTLFVNKIFGRNAYLLQNVPALTRLDDDREIAFAVADTPAAVGFLPFADYQQNPAGLRLLAVDGIRPDGQTVSNGRYVLTYPLLLYVDEATLATKAQSGAFLLYYLAQMNGLMGKVGVFPIGEAGYERTKTVLLTALGQERYLAQFPPTSTPLPPPTATPTVTPTAPLTVTVAVTVAVTR